MKTVAVSDIKTTVRKILDEQGLNDSEFVDADQNTLELDVCIESKILDAVNFVHRNADRTLIDGMDLDVSSLNIKSNLDAEITIPTDDNKAFHRLVSIKMSDWEIPVISEIYEGTPEYSKQKNEFVKGSYEAPVVAFVDSAAGKKLELYSCKTASSTVDYAKYLPYQTTFTDDDGVDSILVSDRLDKAFYYMVAGTVLVTYTDKNADTLINLSNTYMGHDNSGK